MKKIRPTKLGESGITLIALLVMIVILIILATVTIRALFGDEPLIKTATNAGENYKYSHYEEQVKQVVQGEIISKSAIGEIASIQNVQEALIDEEWVKTAKIDEGWTEEEGVIIVRVVEGYIYQVYYNSKYGKIIVDNLGKDIPQADLDNLTVTGRYEIQRGKPVVFGTAEDKTKGVKTLELYLNETDEKIGDTKEKPQGEQSWQAERTGWYKIKATSNSGAIKYAYVRVKNISDLLKAPVIEIEPQGEQKAGWYGADGKELWIKVSTDNKVAKEIHYTLTGGQLVDDAKGEVKEENGQKYMRFQITETGITNIIAWTEDGNGNSSLEATDVTKFDNIAPEIIKADLEGTKGDNGWYTSQIVNIAIDAVDLNGKDNLAEEDKRKTLDGYTYRITSDTDQEIKAETHETDISKKIAITEDGKYKIYIRAIDQAGNKSEETKVEINKDSTPPTVGTPRIDNITGTSFRINVSAGDDTSGVASYEYKINGTTKNVPNQNTATITGLSKSQTYNIEVIVKDNAGNLKSVTTTGTTTNTAPTITASYANDKGTDYIKINATGSDADADRLTYTLYVSTDGINWGTAKETLSNQRQGRKVTLTASELVEYTEYYWKVEVTDGIATASTGRQGPVRTYCPGNFECNGPFQECTACAGFGWVCSGYRPSWEPPYHYCGWMRADYATPYPYETVDICPWCGEKAPNTSWKGSVRLMCDGQTTWYVGWVLLDVSMPHHTCEESKNASQVPVKTNTGTYLRYSRSKRNKNFKALYEKRRKPWSTIMYTWLFGNTYLVQDT